MAKHEVVVVVCDKCGHEDRNEELFLHVIVSPVPINGKKVKNISERDLCLSCVGLPGVNRDK